MRDQLSRTTAVPPVAPLETSLRVARHVHDAVLLTGRELPPVPPDAEEHAA